MKTKSGLIFIFLFIFACRTLASVSLPFKPRFSEKGRLTFDFSSSYSSIPLFPSNRDLLAYDFTTRYGLAENREVFLHLGGFFSELKTLVDNTIINTKEAELDSISIGITSLLKKEDLLPGILGNMEVFLASKVKPFSPLEDRRRLYFSKWSIGAAIFYTSDPLMPVINLGYSLRPERTTQDLTLDLADLFYIQPLIYFIVNSEVSLYSGFSLNNWTNSYQNGQIQEIERRELIFHSGANFILTKETSLFVRFDISQSYPMLTIQLTRK